MKHQIQGPRLLCLGRLRVGICLAGLTALCQLALTSRAAVPTPEKLLPEDTLVMVTAPDFAKLKEIIRKSPESQLWNDPAMKPFRDKFMSKLDEEFVKPLERDLNVSFDNYTSLLQGQVTLGLTQNGWQGQDDQSPGLLLLVDAKDKSAQLKKNLAELRKKWVDAGKTIKTEKIRDVEFSVLSFSTNDIPKTLRTFFMQPPRFQPVPQVPETPAESEPAQTASKTELVLGQVESLLILGNSTKAVEKVVAKLAGGAMPALGDSAAYQANHLAMFREAPCYGWVNAKAFIDILIRKLSEKKASEAANVLDSLNPEKLIGATGLAGLKTIAFSMQDSGDGSLFQVFLGVPEASRQGLFKILAWEAKDSSAPPFVPGDAVKFQRWRMDGQKAWATLEKMLSDISPQAGGTLNFLLDSANAYAKQKDEGFDIKKNLIGNLGDDMIGYEKAPRGSSAAEQQSPPSLFLLGSPNPEQLTAALKSILIFMSQQAGAPTEREFLGRKIFSVPLPSMPLPGVPKPTGPRTLNYAASRGYVAFSTDASILEEYLRSSESQAKALRETPGLAEAAQKVGGTGTGLFGYENDLETTRATFEAWKRNSSTNAADFNPLPGMVTMPGALKSFQAWMDFSLLPAYDQVSKYFYFTVYGGSVNVDGLTLKLFAPVPPASKGSAVVK